MGEGLHWQCQVASALLLVTNHVLQRDDTDKLHQFANFQKRLYSINTRTIQNAETHEKQCKKPTELHSVGFVGAPLVAAEQSAQLAAGRDRA